MCSKVDEEDCHQIDHCQLVSGPNNECTCQDPCQNSNNQDTMVRFHNFCPVKYYIQVSDKVEKILKGSLDLILSPSPSVKIQIMGRKVCFRCKGKTLLGVLNKLFVFKSLLTSPSDVLPYYLK